MGVFLVYSIIYVIYISFHDFSVIAPEKFIGLDNYYFVFQDSVFLESLGNTLIYMFGSVPFMLAFGLLLALLINRKSFGIAWFRAAYFMPVVTSMVAVGIIWKWIFNSSFGVLNYVLRLLGLINEDIAWLANPSTALPAVMVVDIWKQAGFFMVILISRLQSIPSELYEAASIDGAGKFSMFRYITIPLLNPAIVFASITGLTATAKAFEQIYVMTKGGPVHSTTTLVYYVYENGIRFFDMGYASAVALVLFLLTLIVSLISLKLITRKIDY